eukprot:TRINITY_DN3180_c0_g1_i1.p1 TRINITY_DN3180_c0_g1~~TRINITY_DN3180_c0_g1_i1.p1  ORF type:complete len:413 (-),score=33.46 TRINITY_DN3180_c0_g1_i1:239-1477(-)
MVLFQLLKQFFCRVIKKQKGQICSMRHDITFRPSRKASIQVPLPVRSAGHYEVDAGFAEAPMRKNFIEMFWCVKGRGVLVFDDVEYSLDAEHCCFYFPGDFHRIRSASAIWEYYWFTLDPEDPEGLIAAMALRRQPFYVGRCPENRFIKLLSELRDFSPSGQYRASVTAYDILIRAVSGGMRGEEHDLADRFKDMVEEYSHKPDLSVSELADMLGVHRTTLNRVFNEATGMTPGDYLQSYRIQEALSLLKGTDMRVGEIVEKTGFSDANYFSKAVRKFTGYSPGEFRRRQILISCVILFYMPLFVQNLLGKTPVCLLKNAEKQYSQLNPNLTALTKIKKIKKPRSGTNSTGSAGTLVAEGEMYSPATHCNSLKLDMSITFFLSGQSDAIEKCYGGDFWQCRQFLRCFLQSTS